VQAVRTSPAEHHTCAKAWRPSARQDGHQSAEDCPGCRYTALLASRRLTATRYRPLSQSYPSLFVSRCHNLSGLALAPFSKPSGAYYPLVSCNKMRW
jgi:hypothetical protein